MKCPKHPDAMIPWWSAEHGYHMRCKAGGIIEPEDVGWECGHIGREITKAEYDRHWNKGGSNP